MIRLEGLLAVVWKLWFLKIEQIPGTKHRIWDFLLQGEEKSGLIGILLKVSAFEASGVYYRGFTIQSSSFYLLPNESCEFFKQILHLRENIDLETCPSQKLFIYLTENWIFAYHYYQHHGAFLMKNVKKGICYQKLKVCNMLPKNNRLVLQ